MRQFREEIIPGLAEQFAGMGSGGLSSSGFRNATVHAGRDLSERLGRIRAELRNQAAGNLSNLGQFGLGQFNENIYREKQPGLLGSLGNLTGQAAGALGGPAVSALGGAFGNWIGKKLGPYGNQQNPNVGGM